jgi:hypothetical protein
MQTAPGTFFRLDRQALSLMLRHVADSFWAVWRSSLLQQGRLKDEHIHSKGDTTMKKAYTAPSIEPLGSLSELTEGSKNPNGCYGNGKDKTFTHTDGYGNGETGCLS